MIGRLPLWPTLLVAAAAATMVALGLWQLDRAREKQALVAVWRGSAGRPPIAFPPLAPVAPHAMFRRSAALCLEVVEWQVEAGRSAKGAVGYRQIARCRTGAEGPGLIVDMGVSADPKARPDWRGGPVSGLITTEPDHNSLVSRALGRAVPLRPMLVADRPAPGLQPSAPPSPDSVPNNHFSYAVQWFLFAGLAILIYWLALRRRQREQEDG